MTVIDLDQLALVTGGTQQPQAPQAAPSSDPGGAPPQQGGSLLSGLDGFLGFLQTDSFQQLLGGLRSLLGSFGGQQAAAPAQPAPSQGA